MAEADGVRLDRRGGPDAVVPAGHDRTAAALGVPEVPTRPVLSTPT